MAREITAAELKQAFRTRLSAVIAQPYSQAGDIHEVALRKVIAALQDFEDTAEMFAHRGMRVACVINDEPPGTDWIG